MLHIKADGLSFSIPTIWSELTLKQFLAITSIDDRSSALLVALSGLPEETFRPLRAPDLDELVAEHIQFLKDEPPTFYELPAPKRLIISGKTVKVPQNLGTQSTISQKWDAEAQVKALQQEGVPINPVTAAKTLLSIYLCPRILGQPYTSSEQAEAVWPLIEQLPATEAIALSAFFLTSWRNLPASGRIRWQISQPTIRRSLPGRLLRTLTRMITTLHCGKSPRSTAFPS